MDVPVILSCHDIVHRVPLTGRVGPDLTLGNIRSAEFPDPGKVFVFFRYQRIEMDRAAGPDKPEGFGQKFCTGKREVHDDPVKLP